LLTHLLAYRAARKNPSRVAWIGAYEFALARTIYVASIAPLPLWVVLAYIRISIIAHEHPLTYGVLGSLSVGLSSLSVWASVESWKKSAQDV